VEAADYFGNSYGNLSTLSNPPEPLDIRNLPIKTNIGHAMGRLYLWFWELLLYLVDGRGGAKAFHL
jgi:hypothetical protein